MDLWAHDRERRGRNGGITAAAPIKRVATNARKRVNP